MWGVPFLLSDVSLTGRFVYNIDMNAYQPNQPPAMSTLDQWIDSIRHSPQLPVVLNLLQEQWADEQRRREQFYNDMTEDQKAEFIEGEVIVHSPARDRHTEVVQQIAQLLNLFVQLHGLGKLRVEKSLVIFPRNAYEPNIVFFGSEKASQISPETLKYPIPDFIVEVLSDSTEKNDRGVKFEDYAVNGVGEYWIVDADRGIVEQYLLSGGQYGLAVKAASGRLKSEIITGFETDIEAFFDAQKNLDQLKRLLGSN